MKKQSKNTKKEDQSPTQTSPSKPFERWDAINYIIRHAQPYHMEVECLDSFIEELLSPHFKGDYQQAASDALYEWDI